MAVEQQHRDELAAAADIARRIAPETEPYKHLYEARSKLETYRATLCGEEHSERIAEIDCQLGAIALQVEEPHVAEVCLERALPILAPDGEAPKDVEVLIQYALLKDGRGHAESARVYLERAEKTASEEAKERVTFFLAQVYGKLGMRDLSAEYCRRTLERQPESQEYVRNALGLSSYYGASEKGEEMARRGLCVAKKLGDEEGVATAHIHLAKSAASLPRARAHFEKAKKYFVLDGFVTEHVGILRDESVSWAIHEKEKESDLRRKVAICRKRADLLEPPMLALNPEIYRDLRNVLAFEIGQCYSRALDLKEPLLEPAASAAKLRTCRDLRKRAVEAFDTVSFPSEKDDVLPYLNALLTSARLAGKLYGDRDESTLVQDSLSRFVNTKEKANELLTEYYPNDTDDLFKDELKLCAEMIELLPKKISQIS